MECQFKIVIIGESGVGKSSLLERMVHGSFNPNQQITIGAAFYSLRETTSRGRIKLNLWDTAGAERYKSLQPLYLREANIAIICSDSDDVNTFISYINGIHNVEEKCHIVLVVTKFDRIEQSNPEELSEFVDSNGYSLFYTSAKTSQGVPQLKAFLVDMCTRIEKPREVLPPVPIRRKSKCFLL